MAENVVSRANYPAYLQGVAREFRAPQMVADLVAPPRPVTKESGRYRIFGKDNLVQSDNTWAPGAIPNEITSQWSSDTYFAETRVLRHKLLDHELANDDGSIDLRARYTTKVSLATQVAREARVATLFTTAGNYPGANVLAKAGGAEWNAVGVINTVQPITDMEAQIQVVTDGSLVPRSELTVVIPEQVMNKAIRHNTAIRDYFKYTAGGVLTADILGSLLGVGRVLVASGQFGGSGPLSATADISTGIPTTNLWGETVWIGAVDANDMDLMGFARQFVWRAATGGQDIQIRQYRMADEGQRGDWIEGAEARDAKITANFAGAIITNTLA